MKIGDASPIRNAAAARKAVKSGASGASFDSYLDSAHSADSAIGVSGAGEVAATGSLLSLQEVVDEGTRREQEVKRGETMLEALERLRHSLLTGSVPPVVLRELEGRLANQRQHIDDPKLMELMDDIELRVAVELAKLERAMRDVSHSGDLS